jgi:hypothetical protein
MADREVRNLTTKMPLTELLEFCDQMSKLGRSLQKFKEPLVIEEDCETLGIKAGSYNLQKFIYDHFIRCFYNERLGLDYSNWANMDWYAPDIQDHLTREQVTAWYAENGFAEPKFVDLVGWEHAGFFVSGRKRQ